VVFVCHRGHDLVEIPARPEFVSSTANATTLSKDGASVSTVEHLLATLRCLGVDNVRVEVEGPEVPVMDGSAAYFDDLLRTVGSVAQSEPRRALVLKKPLVVADGSQSIRIEPADTLCVSYALDFEHPAIGRQEHEIRDLTARVFQSELAGARTFGFLDEVDSLRRAGLAGGASLENTVVLDDTGVMNPDGLRWPNEFVRHKVLDLLGDLALTGHPIRGHIRVERGGHALHHKLLAELQAKPDAWQLEREEALNSRDALRADSPTPA
jgi:UDP-3-O-[3-hydroxymyristoyl] N-acetylglucosamine deacetylase